VSFFVPVNSEQLVPWVEALEEPAGRPKKVLSRCDERSAASLAVFAKKDRIIMVLIRLPR